MAADPAEYEVAFQIISFAGSARSSAMMAIREAREGHQEEAAKLLAEADEQLNEAHRTQTKMLSAEARGDKVPLNIIVVHAQDHLSGAIMTRDLAGELVDLIAEIKPASGAADA